MTTQDIDRFNTEFERAEEETPSKQDVGETGSA